MVLRQTFVQKEQEEEKEPELVEEEESADDFTRYQESEVEA
jgi:hypothetical protein